MEMRGLQCHEPVQNVEIKQRKGILRENSGFSGLDRRWDASEERDRSCLPIDVSHVDWSNFGLSLRVEMKRCSNWDDNLFRVEIY